MPVFSEKSLVYLNECHPILKRAAHIVIQYVDFKVICSARNEEDQFIAFNSGKSKVRWPNGKHNCIQAFPESERGSARKKWPNVPEYSMAMDIMPYPLPKKGNIWDEKYAYRFSYIIAHFNMAIYRMFRNNETMYIPRNGCDWDGDGDLDDNEFNDLGHIELILPPKNMVLPEILSTQLPIF